ncbi:hypothetical protein D3C72_1913490 [compost metagenome]
MDVRGVETVEQRQLALVDGDAAFAEVAQLVEQAERIGAVGHGIGRKAEADGPAGAIAAVLIDG